ncbi:MAG: hypothetical protein JWO12_2724 [Frankiales bacterium]|nr:hypothetical protein [Frankiales bacterium]
MLSFGCRTCNVDQQVLVDDVDAAAIGLSFFIEHADHQTSLMLDSPDQLDRLLGDRTHPSGS